MKISAKQSQWFRRLGQRKHKTTRGRGRWCSEIQRGPRARRVMWAHPGNSAKTFSMNGMLRDKLRALSSASNERPIFKQKRPRIVALCSSFPQSTSMMYNASLWSCLRLLRGGSSVSTDASRRSYSKSGSNSAIGAVISRRLLYRRLSNSLEPSRL